MPRPQYALRMLVAATLAAAVTEGTHEDGRRELVSYGPLNDLDEYEMRALAALDWPYGGTDTLSRIAVSAKANAAQGDGAELDSPSLLAAMLAMGQRTVALFEESRLEPLANQTEQSRTAYNVFRARTHGQGEEVPRVRSHQTTKTASTPPFCAGEKPSEQPLGAFCSGVLLAPTLLATAAHCLDGGLDAAARFCESGKLIVARGYAIDTPQETAERPAETAGALPRRAQLGPIARCKDVVAYARDASPLAGVHVDYAVLRIDTPLLPPDAPPLNIVAPSELASTPSARLLAIGHPTGMPRKYAHDGRWIMELEHAGAKKDVGDEAAPPIDEQRAAADLWLRHVLVGSGGSSSPPPAAAGLANHSAPLPLAPDHPTPPPLPTRHIITVDAFRGSSGGPVFAYTPGETGRMLGLAGLLTGGHTYDFRLSLEEAGGCLRTNHCKEAENVAPWSRGAAVRCEDGSVSAGEVMHDALFFHPFLNESAHPTERAQLGGNGTDAGALCNGRGVPGDHLECTCAPGYGGTLCGKVRTRSGCTCDEAALWPEGPDKARAAAQGALSPGAQQAREAFCVPFASKTRCYVDARSCETAPASAPDAPVPFGAVRGADIAWDYC